MIRMINRKKEHYLKENDAKKDARHEMFVFHFYFF
jgi:hypothetical protein